MIMVTGGRCQGKLSFVRELGKRGEIELTSGRIADGDTDGADAAFTGEIICHLELFIRQIMERGEDPEVFIKRLIRENPGAVVITDEIGSGIVPVDSFEREYRETTGRICQQAAAASECVYRVIMGIGTKIKG